MDLMHQRDRVSVQITQMLMLIVGTIVALSSAAFGQTPGTVNEADPILVTENPLDPALVEAQAAIDRAQRVAADLERGVYVRRLTNDLVGLNARYEFDVVVPTDTFPALPARDVDEYIEALGKTRNSCCTMYSRP